jgi:undecaprenyl diphosphate synthase
MDMLGSFLKAEIATMKANGIKFRTIGRTERLPASVRTWIDKAMSETAANTGLVLNLALSYGGRGEILEAVRRMQHAAGSAAGPLTEEAFAAYLDTAGLPDPDLIIRTSGEKRISNFLLWQAAYAELYFAETLWPDFEEKDLLTALIDYQGRQRRFGLTQDQLVQKS